MTWTYTLAADNSSMDVLDHTGAVVATVQNGGDGFEVPGDVLDVMHSELQAALGAGDNARAIEIAGDAACEQIEEAA